VKRLIVALAIATLVLTVLPFDASRLAGFFAAADPEGPREEVLPQLFATADPEGPREEVLPWLTADVEGPREELIPPLFA
jgi:hypothetical protein